jgi:(S)-mandelate dehydrogenase
VVSNHGGRQLDGAAATLDALPAIASVVGKQNYRPARRRRAPRRRHPEGARAGAQAVLTGRATLFGCMAGGEPGARRALEILQTELVRAMQLCGARSPAELGPELLRAKFLT